MVDHIEQHRDDPELFWDANNWQVLCATPCHNQIKRQHDMSGKTTERWFDYLRSLGAAGVLLAYLPPHIQEWLDV